MRVNEPRHAIVSVNTFVDHEANALWARRSESDENPDRFAGSFTWISSLQDAELLG